MTSLVHLAARNNAHLYERVCGAHECITVVKDSHLLCLSQPPRFYGQAVTLLPGVGEVIALEVTGGFKDSFHDIEPDKERYELLFEASWIHSMADAPGELALEWKQVQNPEGLDEWESGWAYGDDEADDHPRQFPHSLLDCSDLSFHSAWKNGELVGGVIFNGSESVVGCSNLWAKGGSLEAVWQDLPSYAGRVFPRIDLVGYERGEDLNFALKVGFEVIGPLRVWVPKLPHAK